MLLGTRIAWQVGAAVIGLVLVGAGGTMAVARLDARLALALREYRHLRDGYQVGVRIVQIRESLKHVAGAAGHRKAEEQLAVLAADVAPASTGQAPPAGLLLNPVDAEALGVKLEQALQELHAGGAAPAGQRTDRILAEAVQIVGGATHAAQARIRVIESSARADQQRALFLVTTVSALTLLVVGVLGWRHHRAVMVPLHRLAAATGQLAAGRWAGRVPTAGDRELAMLAEDFNRRADRVTAAHRDLEQKVQQRSVQLVRAERLASVGMLAAGVAHEVNNPLGIILGQAELALHQSDAAPSDHRRRFEAICEEAVRCKQIITKLMSLAQPTTAGRQPLDIAALINEVAALLQGEADRRGCRLLVEIVGAGPLTVVGDRIELTQVLVNLLLNALVAASDAGPAEPWVRVEATRDGDMARITVRDNGVGMSSDTLDRLFEPFFTTRRGAQHHGAGLGLSVSLTLVQGHGGTLDAFSDGPGRGSAFTLRLPMATDADSQPTT